MTPKTSVLDRARARRRRRLERDRRATLTHLLHLLDRHAPDLGICEAYVFGSLIRPGRFREDSDVDVAVQGVNPEAFFEVMSLLSAALERPVDLVDLSECHFARRIRERGILWSKSSSCCSSPTRGRNSP